MSLVTSRISLVMLTSLPATGGTRRKSRILVEGQGVASSLVPLGAPPDLNGLALPCQAPTSAPPQKPGALQSPKGVYPLLQSCTRSRATKGRAVLRDSRPWVSSEKLTPQVSWPLFLTASSQQPTPAVAMTRGARWGTMMMRGAHRGLTCPGGRRRSPHYASRSRRSKRSREASPAPLFAWREQDKTEAVFREKSSQWKAAWLVPAPRS